MCCKEILHITSYHLFFVNSIIFRDRTVDRLNKPFRCLGPWFRPSVFPLHPVPVSCLTSHAHGSAVPAGCVAANRTSRSASPQSPSRRVGWFAPARPSSARVACPDRVRAAGLTPRSVSPVQPIFAGTEPTAAHCELCSPSCSNTIQTPRSRERSATAPVAGTRPPCVALPRSTPEAICLKRSGRRRLLAWICHGRSPPMGCPLASVSNGRSVGPHDRSHHHFLFHFVRISQKFRVKRAACRRLDHKLRWILIVVC